MKRRPTVLLIDDGELVRVRELLTELEAEVDELRGEAMPEDVEQPYDVVVTTAQRAIALADPHDARLPSKACLPGKAVWIAVHHQDFLPLRDRLRGMGVHYLVHLTVDSAVLRLLLLHALYRGPERRDAPRLLAGSTVSCRLPGSRWPATLVDLTLDGCRLLAPHAVAWGSSIAVALPAGLAGEGEVVLQGRVVRSEPDADSPPQRERHLLALTFDSLHPSWVQLWDTVLKGRAIGTRVTRLADDRTARHGSDDAEPSQQPPRASKKPSDRRRQRRGSYDQRVLAIAEEATHVIVGRDLSVGGMRVDPHPQLWVGARVLLSIVCGSDDEALVVHARVERDDGEAGLVIRFNHGAPELRQRLQGIVASLPAIESVGEDGPPGVRVLASVSPDEGPSTAD